MKSYFAAFQDLIKQGVHPKTLVACVYGLYQDYAISEDMEDSLYALVDPDEQYNDPGAYWNALDEESDPTWRYIKAVANKTIT